MSVVGTLVSEGAGQQGCKAVIVDVSAVRVLDATDFRELRSMLEIARLLGARPILAGLSPWIVAYLVESDVDVHGLEAARDLEDALDRVWAD